MTDEQLKIRNNTRLSELYPPFAKHIEEVLKELTNKGWRPRIQCAYRSPEEQLAAYRAGRSSLKWGLHNANKNGKPEALAADIVNDNNPYNEPVKFYTDLDMAARGQGLMTGIVWKNPYDPWHVQPKGMNSAKILAAKMGWRPRF